MGDGSSNESDETGRPEVFVQAMQGGTGRRQLSMDGGRFPRWSRDGQTLFWLGSDSSVMKCSVRIVGDELETSVPEPLFNGNVLQSGNGAWDVTPDGGFLLQTVEDQPFDEVHIILNWPSLLKR